MLSVDLPLLHAILELGLCSNTPLEQPFPWYLPVWSEATGLSRAPWQADATMESVAASEGLLAVRTFAIGFFSLKTRKARAAFILAPPSGLEIEGREHILGYLTHELLNAEFDEWVDGVLERYSLHKGSEHSLETLARGADAEIFRSLSAALLGDEGVVTHGILDVRVTRFVAAVLARTYVRWVRFQEEEKETLLRLTHRIFQKGMAISSKDCCIEDICTYLHELYSLICALDFDEHEDGMHQRQHYANMLLVMRTTVLSGNPPTEPGLNFPCKMLAALKNLTKNGEGEQVLRVLDSVLSLLHGQDDSLYPPVDVDIHQIRKLYTKITALEISDVLGLDTYDLQDGVILEERDLRSIDPWAAERAEALLLTRLTLPQPRK